MKIDEQSINCGPFITPIFGVTETPLFPSWMIIKSVGGLHTNCITSINKVSWGHNRMRRVITCNIWEISAPSPLLSRQHLGLRPTVWHWPLTWTIIGVICFIDAFTVPSFETFKHCVKRYWADNSFLKTSSFTLTFDHGKSKSIGVIYSQGHPLYQVCTGTK